MRKQSKCTLQVSGRGGGGEGHDTPGSTPLAPPWLSHLLRPGSASTCLQRHLLSCFPSLSKACGCQPRTTGTRQVTVPGPWDPGQAASSPTSCRGGTASSQTCPWGGRVLLQTRVTHQDPRGSRDMGLSRLTQEGPGPVSRLAVLLQMRNHHCTSGAQAGGFGSGLVVSAAMCVSS